MNRAISIAALALLLILAATMTPTAQAADENPALGKLRHVVLFAWKEGTPATKIKEIEDGFRGLPAKIPAIADFEWGTDCSVEGLADGFTHAFLVTFNTAKDREIYLPHPAHQAFVALLKPHLEKVLVIDYKAGK